ncbi:MAG: hypothetical protein ACP5N1_05945 [Candidatus Woesearchaeota archaeon]
MITDELTTAISELKKINSKMLQALQLRTNIVTMRIDALSSYNDSKLRKVHNDELLFMRVMEKGIPDTINILSIFKKQYKLSLTKDDWKNLSKLLDKLLKISEFANDNLSFTKKRIEAEKELIANPSIPEVRKSYLKIWSAELKSEEKMLSIYNSEDEELSQLLQMKIDPMNAMAAAIPIGVLLPELLSGDPNIKKVLIYGIVLVVVIFVTIINSYGRSFRLQQDTLLRLQKA